MYIDECKTGQYTRYLLRESYREDGKVKHRTIANLSHCSPEEIQAIRLALKHKDDLAALASIADDIRLEQGLSVGAIWTIYGVAKQGRVAKIQSTLRKAQGPVKKFLKEIERDDKVKFIAILVGGGLAVLLFLAGFGYGSFRFMQYIIKRWKNERRK